MRELSLFTGAGGGILGTKLLGWTPIGYVEWDDYCQRILRQRQEDGLIETAPIFSDIRAFISEGYAERYRGMVDVITAGFPCQPFSVAGKQAGEDDPRNMWPATLECIRMVRPRYALLENVPGLLATGYCTTIFRDLAESGYDARWRVLSAAEVGAPHKRDRFWILAQSESNGLQGGGSGKDSEGNYRENGATHESIRDGSSSETQHLAYPKHTRLNAPEVGTGVTEGSYSDSQGEKSTREPTGLCGGGGGENNMADTSSQRQSRQGRSFNAMHPKTQGAGQGDNPIANTGWSIEPNVGRVANGVASRVDRLKAIGNGQVPQCVAKAWELLSK